MEKLSFYNVGCRVTNNEYNNNNKMEFRELSNTPDTCQILFRCKNGSCQNTSKIANLVIFPVF